MGALRKTLVYLGLADDAYDDELEPEEPDMPRPRSADTAVERVPDRQTPRGVDRLMDTTRPGERRATVTPLPHVVGAQGPMQRITAVHPRSYTDARIIGEHFREGIPVIMNQSEMEDAEAKRLVDFAAGLVYGLQGAVERVTAKVFLLSPAAVEVTNETQEPTSGSGFFNQS